MTASLTARLDDRLRLAGLVLAAGEWPEREQALKAYKPHRAAEAARRRFGSLRAHPAVVAAQALAGAPEGEGVERLYQHALAWQWPADLAAHLPGFVAVAQPQAYLAETQAEWESALGDTNAVIQRLAARASLPDLLQALFGLSPPNLVFCPNLLYPGRRALALWGTGELVVALPPPPAWGTSPPWRYSERPDEVAAALAEAFARPLAAQALPPAQAASVALAAAVLFVREAEDPAAGDQFMLMERKARGLPRLPALVEALAERHAGGAVSLEECILQAGL